jgi:hypothetical protein
MSDYTTIPKITVDDAIIYWQEFLNEAKDMIEVERRSFSDKQMLREQIEVTEFTIEELNRLKDLCD